MHRCANRTEDLKSPIFMTSAGRVVNRYLSLVNQHDIEGALGCLSETFELQFGDSDNVVTKGAMANALRWDAGTNGHLDYKVVESDGSEVIIEGHESNDFLSLIGIVGLSFRSRFEVSERGLIERQAHHVDWGSVTIDVAMEPLIEWASVEEPEELKQIYPNGRLVYTERAAERWVALAKRWRESVSQETRGL